jgi:hypothetical protein
MQIYIYLMLVRKANAVEEATKWVMWLYDQQSVHTNDWWNGSDTSFC